MSHPRGAIAQLGERLDRTQEVAGSSPASSTLAAALFLRCQSGVGCGCPKGHIMWATVNGAIWRVSVSVVRVAGILLSLSVLLGLPTAARASLVWSSPAPIDRSEPGQMQAIACPSGSQCTAVDGDGQQVTFNPSSPSHPTPMVVDPGGRLTGVACPRAASAPPSATLAGGDVRSDFAWHTDPQDHRYSRRASRKQLLAVACPTTTQCTAIDNSVQEVTFNPTSPGNPDADHDRARLLLGAGGVGVPVQHPVHRRRQRRTRGDVQPDLARDTPAQQRSTPLRSLGWSCPSASQCTAADLGEGEVTFDPTSPGSPARVRVGAGLRWRAQRPLSAQPSTARGRGHIQPGFARNAHPHQGRLRRKPVGGGLPVREPVHRHRPSWERGDVQPDLARSPNSNADRQHGGHTARRRSVPVGNSVHGGRLLDAGVDLRPHLARDPDPRNDRQHPRELLSGCGVPLKEPMHGHRLPWA